MLQDVVRYSYSLIIAIHDKPRKPEYHLILRTTELLLTAVAQPLHRGFLDFTEQDFLLPVFMQGEQCGGKKLTGVSLSVTW